MKIVLAALSLLLGTAVLGAQARGVVLTLLQQGDSSVRGREVMTTVAEFAPGSDTGWHTHPGEMVGYMVTGAVLIQQQGRQAETIREGEAFIIPAGVAHICSNPGDASARMSATFVLQKGRPFRTNIARP
jgi:quercetin dioxygenase-like cupin family protein